jgi:cell division protease FtsH
VPNPDVKGREQILKVHMKKVPLSPSVDPKVIARGTPGFSGADLANLVNEAALMAARRGKLAVGKVEFDVAKDKIMMGAERRTLVMTESEMKTTAYHEGGHAIVSFYMEDSDPIHKATIVPRGRALGMVQLLPEGDRVSESRNKLIASIKVAMGGRIAEELIFGPGKVTTGAQSDIKAATYYATHMMTETGLGDALSFRNYSTRDDQYPGMTKPYSEEIGRKIDAEINTLLDDCYVQTSALLKDKEAELHRLAAALLERETLTGDEIRIVLGGGELPPMPTTSDDDLPRTSVPSI